MTIYKKFFIVIIILIIFLYFIYYMSNVDTLINVIYNLANDDDISITKINVIVFNDFDRYNYSLVEKNGIQEFINKLNEIKILKNNFRGLLNNKIYHNLHFENYLISLYEESRLVASFQIIRKDVQIEGVTNSPYYYRIVNYSNVDLEMLYRLASKYGEVTNE